MGETGIMVSFVIGILFAFGTMRTVIIVDALSILACFAIVGYLAPDWRKIRKLFPLWLLLLVSLGLISLIFTESIPRTFTFTLRILTIGMIGRFVYLYSFNRKAFILGFTLALIPQTLFIVFQSFSIFRPAGFSVNSSQGGETGMVLFWAGAYPVAIFQIAASGARQAIIGVWSWGILEAIRQRSLMLACMVLLTSVVFGLAGIPTGRNNYGDIGRHIASRAQILEGTGIKLDKLPGSMNPNSIPVVDKIPEIKPELRLFGYGLGAYIAATNGTRPHNIFVLALFELGILIIIPIILIVWIIRFHLISYIILFSLFIQFLGTEEWIGRPEGYYMFGIILLLFGIKHSHSRTVYKSEI